MGLKKKTSKEKGAGEAPGVQVGISCSTVRKDLSGTPCAAAAAVSTAGRGVS